MEDKRRLIWKQARKLINTLYRMMLARNKMWLLIVRDDKINIKCNVQLLAIFRYNWNGNIYMHAILRNYYFYTKTPTSWHIKNKSNIKKKILYIHLSSYIQRKHRSYFKIINWIYLSMQGYILHITFSDMKYHILLIE